MARNPASVLIVTVCAPPLLPLLPQKYGGAIAVRGDYATITVNSTATFEGNTVTTQVSAVVW